MATDRLRKWAVLAALAIAVSCLCGCGGKEEAAEERREMTMHAVYDGVDLPDSLWQAPQYYRDTQNDRSDAGISGQIQAIYYRSDYLGEESYAFAFLGIPEGASAQSKRPAVLLIHGGGGTAYWQWVREWVNRGYVALAMDLEGHVPKPEGTSDNMPADLYVDSQYNAPHNSNYGDASLPIEQTWMYYAVSTSVLGNSLLHSLEFVDRYKVGVCGVSWGGVITSVITGYDDRFAFSIPIYCSLNLAQSRGGTLNSYYRAHPEARVWDDDEGLSRVETPIFFLAMNDDVNALPDSISNTASRCKNATVALVRNWAHSHSHAFARLEPYEFADSIINGKSDRVRVLTQPAGNSGKVDVFIPEGKKVKAYIAFTGGNMDKIPQWGHIRLTVQEGSISYEITEQMRQEAGGEVTFFYIWLADEYNCVVSTQLAQVG